SWNRRPAGGPSNSCGTSALKTDSIERRFVQRHPTRPGAPRIESPPACLGRLRSMALPRQPGNASAIGYTLNIGNARAWLLVGMALAFTIMNSRYPERVTQKLALGQNVHPWHDSDIDEALIATAFPVVIEIPRGSTNK